MPEAGSKEPRGFTMTDLVCVVLGYAVAFAMIRQIWQ